MLKSFFILVFSYISLTAGTYINLGDKLFKEQNYIQALKYYQEAYIEDEANSKIKLINTYLQLGDKYFIMQNYKKAEKYYNLALKLNSNEAKQKLSRVFEREGDLYLQGKKFRIALLLYKKAFRLGNLSVQKKINSVEETLHHQKQLVDDTRKIVNNDSPVWTKAIGRLIIPTKRTIVNGRYQTKLKKCSATLVNFEDIKSSKVIVTASHCISSFDKKAGTIRFIIKAKNGKVLQKYAKIHNDSKYSNENLKTNSDYAILILSSLISKKEVEPLIIDKRSFIDLKKDYNYSFGSLAGFSGDIGDYGSQLTFDPKCELNYFDGVYSKSNCSGFKGASGGPVVLTTSNDKKILHYYFVGVVSHFRGDKFQEIYFAPHHIFYKELNETIMKYNQ